MIKTINIVTIFPDFVNTFKNFSIIKRALEKQKIIINIIDINKFAINKKVDDYPVGEKIGMILKYDVIYNAINSIKKQNYKVIVSPRGKILNKTIINDLMNKEEITLVCGNYEGFDERIFNHCDEILSIGKYVISNGELAAFIIMQCIIRKIPNVINLDSLKTESFDSGLIDYPKYTKPNIFLNNEIPKILFSGNHQKIKKWQESKQIELTNIWKKIN